MREEKTMRPKKPKSIKLMVHVTEELMQHSKERDSSHCMIAEAVRDAMPAATSISVDLQTIRFSLPERGFRYTYLTPRVAQVALIRFDQGDMPEPFSFRLNGAHVTTMYKRVPVKTPRSRELTVGEQAALAKASEYSPGRMVARHPNVEKTEIVPNGGPGTVPRRVGGKPPPTTAFARRRAFGLRGLDIIR